MTKEDENVDINLYRRFCETATKCNYASSLRPWYPIAAQPSATHIENKKGGAAVFSRPIHTRSGTKSKRCRIIQGDLLF
ncbi:hypothetical protein ATCV1_z275L [Acanthocystis turfacea chlorella virus 1]|uniref:Uncharacterized protein z275L n=1 Tax=Chlorovirus heliozoae TaxID=322019 RepID=A7K8N5_9PHYC|nr:hypothetical protein ATCV1_z275L [Acanthocystis turfacea chlorella virus 1]ABT16409.1 hypothetical protein ATCV1_z275L [Acanthocystis turfacea chlorella virus 1]